MKHTAAGMLAAASALVVLAAPLRAAEPTPEAEAEQVADTVKVSVVLVKGGG